MSLKNLPSYDEPLVTSPHLDQTILDSCCMLSHNLQVIHSANLTSMNQLWSENYKQDRIDKLSKRPRSCVSLLRTDLTTNSSH